MMVKDQIEIKEKIKFQEVKVKEEDQLNMIIRNSIHQKNTMNLKIHFNKLKLFV